MAQDRFDAWRRRGVGLGQRRLADIIRRLIYRADPLLFERLDFADDSQFLHPLLFAYFTDPNPTIAIPHLVYGMLHPERRLGCVPLRTDASGRASLGPIGDIETLFPDVTLEFGRDSRDAPYRCLKGSIEIPFRLRSPLRIPNTRIEVPRGLHPLLKRFLVDRDGKPTTVDAAQAAREHVPHLLLALALLRTHCPSVWTEVAAITRLIVLFRAPLPNSLATLSAHGAIFCNVADNDDEIALLEDVTHQAAHVSFNAFSHDPARVLAIDPETPMHSLCDDPGEVRPVYAALHGLFTYTLICRALSAVLDAAAVSERQSHELLARLGFTMEKFGIDVERLDLPRAYTLAGRRCYNAFAADYRRFRTRYAALLDGLDFTNQPYVFSYAQFVQRNGGPWPCAEELAS